MDATFIPLGLAIYAIGYTMASMHGPFGLCKVFREFVCGKCIKDHNGNCCRWEWVAEGVKCPICWGFWMCLLCIYSFGPLNAFAAWGMVTTIAIWRKGWLAETPPIEDREAPPWTQQQTQPAATEFLNALDEPG